MDNPFNNNDVPNFVLFAVKMLNRPLALTMFMLEKSFLALSTNSVVLNGQ